jgi:hypothetical protein
MDRALRFLHLAALLSIAGAITLHGMSSPAPAPTPPPPPPPPADVHVHVWPTPEVPPGEDTPSAHAGRGSPGRLDLADAPGVLDPMDGVVVSPSRPSLAAYRGRVLWLTVDDGRTWARHDLPAEVATTAASDDGSIHVLILEKSPVIWRFDRDGKRTVYKSPLAPATLEWLVAGHGEIYLYGMREKKGALPVEKELVLLRSKDGGATFADAPAPPYGNYGNEARVEADGTLAVMYGQEASCGGGGQSHIALPPSGTEWQSMAWPLDSPGSFWFGAGGWTYGLGACEPAGTESDEGGRRLCAVSPDENVPAVAGPVTPMNAFVGVTTNGRATYAVVGRNLYSVAAGAFRRVANDTPVSLQSHLSVDAKGRFVGLAGGRIVRRTGRSWEVLLPH